MRLPFVLALLFLVVPSAARAQRLLAHDTLSAETPSAVSCGFCGDEVIGVVFRELPAGAGISASDFPLGLTNVQVALASAMTDGVTCDTLMASGEASAAVEIWAGPTPPETLPSVEVTFGMPWSPEETLVWAGDASLTLSTATVDGDTRFDLQFNAYAPSDVDGLPIVVPAGNAYLRVAVRLPGSGTFNPVCVDPVEVPSGFPLRDNDGVISNHRSHIYGAGIGWAWNENVGVGGDWAIRLEVAPMAGPRDAGMRDAGTDTGSVDASQPLDAAPEMDAGTVSSGGGCGCRAQGLQRPSSLWALGLLALGWMRARRK